jgi:hypothetical protein
VPVLSSAARRPLPGVIISLATLSSVCTSMDFSFLFGFS